MIDILVFVNGVKYFCVLYDGIWFVVFVIMVFSMEVFSTDTSIAWGTVRVSCSLRVRVTVITRCTIRVRRRVRSRVSGRVRVTPSIRG